MTQFSSVHPTYPLYMKNRLLNLTSSQQKNQWRLSPLIFYGLMLLALHRLSLFGCLL